MRYLLSILFICILSFSCFGSSGEIMFKVTNYTASVKECGNSKGITASGVKVSRGIVAADWRYYPPGTVIKLDTGEFLVVADKGGAIKGVNRLDRYNPRYKIDVYPRYSKGFVVHRPRYTSRSQAYSNVIKGLSIRRELIKKHKQNNTNNNKSSKGGWIWRIELLNS